MSSFLFVLLLLAPPSMRGSDPTSTKPSPPSADPERNETYRKAILDLLEKDQEVRQASAEFLKQFQPGPMSPAQSAEIAKLRRHTAGIAAQFKSLYARHGWPGFRKVGRDATAAACIIVQNFENETIFQRKFLAAMKEAAEAGEVDRPALAGMTDRVLVAEKKKQLYGTLISVRGSKVAPLPVEDPKNLDQRRAKMGLMPMEEYLEEVRSRYGQGKKDGA